MFKMTTFTRGFLNTGTSSYLIGVKDNINYILSSWSHDNTTELVFSPYIPISSSVISLKMLPQWDLTTLTQDSIIDSSGILELGTITDTPVIISSTSQFLLSGVYTGVLYSNTNTQTITVIDPSGASIGIPNQSPGILYTTVPTNITTTQIPISDFQLIFLPEIIYKSSSTSLETNSLLEFIAFLTSPNLLITAPNFVPRSSPNHNSWATLDQSIIGLWYDYCVFPNSCGTCYSIPTYGGNTCTLNSLIQYPTSGPLAIQSVPFIVTGAQGPMGPQGIAGVNGPQGSQGLQGPQGEQGLQGDRGPQGFIGPVGSAAESISWTTPSMVFLLFLIILTTIVIVYILINADLLFNIKNKTKQSLPSML